MKFNEKYLHYIAVININILYVCANVYLRACMSVCHAIEKGYNSGEDLGEPVGGVEGEYD